MTTETKAATAIGYLNDDNDFHVYCDDDDRWYAATRSLTAIVAKINELVAAMNAMNGSNSDE